MEGKGSGSEKDPSSSSPRDEEQDPAPRDDNAAAAAASATTATTTTTASSTSMVPSFFHIPWMQSPSVFSRSSNLLSSMRSSPPSAPAPPAPSPPPPAAAPAVPASDVSSMPEQEEEEEHEQEEDQLLRQREARATASEAAAVVAAVKAATAVAQAYARQEGTQLLVHPQEEGMMISASSGTGDGSREHAAEANDEVAAVVESATTATSMKKAPPSPPKTKRSKKGDKKAAKGRGMSQPPQSFKAAKTITTTTTGASRSAAATAASVAARRQKYKRSGSSSSLLGVGKSKRTLNSSSASSYTPLVEYEVASDVDPNRVTNPLVQVPLLLSSNATSSLEFSSHHPNTTAARAQDVWPLLDATSLWRPDTFSIAYLARLLGYTKVPMVAVAAPIANTTTTSGSNDNNINNIITMSNNINNHNYSNINSKPVPWHDAWKASLNNCVRQDAVDSGVLTVPPQGRFAETVWQKRPRPSDYDFDGDNDDEADDWRVLGDLNNRDPLYEDLCRLSAEPLLATAQQVGRLWNKAHEKKVLWPVLQCACELKVLVPATATAEDEGQQHDSMDATTTTSNISSNDTVDLSKLYTVTTLHAYREAHPDAALPLPQWASMPTVCGVLLFEKKHGSDDEDNNNNNNVDETNNKEEDDDNNNATMSTPKNVVFPLASVLYSFEWHPTGLSHAATTSSAAPSSSSSSSSQQGGYEMVMALHDVIVGNFSLFWPSAAAAAASETKQQLPPQEMPLLEDCPQHRLALVLTALALEHARACHVAYAMFRLSPLQQLSLSLLHDSFRLRRAVKRTTSTTAGRRDRGDEEGEETISISANNEIETGGVFNDQKGVPKADKKKGGETAVATTTSAVQKKVKGRKKTVQDTSNDTREEVEPESVTLVCDLHKCCYRYAFLRYLEKIKDSSSQKLAVVARPNSGDDDDDEDSAMNAADDSFTTTSSLVVVPPHRWLARLPNLDDASSALTETEADVLTMTTTASAGITTTITDSRTKKSVARKPSLFLTGASAGVRPTVVRFRAKLNTASTSTSSSSSEQQEDHAINCCGGVKLVHLDTAGVEGSPIEVPTMHRSLELDLLRDFELMQQPSTMTTTATRTTVAEAARKSEILQMLMGNQNQLQSLELNMEPILHKLMDKVIEERLDFENGQEAAKKAQEEAILKQYERTLERRKEQDLAWQKQLEQDMDAVCDVCKDGEVSPDNQILFCEACNVAVHQMCYGVDKIPEGDYYCIACRYLGRDDFALTRKTGIRLAASPLPICCELCPRKQGAFIRSDYSSSNSQGDNSFGKWVHAVCAKWQGLNYVRAPDILEDVTELKYSFRRLNIKCSLCLGERGGMNECRHSGCKNWLHVTCARAVGSCEVIHGEDVRGPVAENPWSLMCPEHSNIKAEDIPKDAISVESLIETANEFPPEPRPPPTPIAPKPFNAATGDERNRLLVNRAYEKELLVELTEKKLHGVRCDVCDQEVDFKIRTRCNACGVVFCLDCSLKQIDGTDGNFRCAACAFTIQKQKAGEEFTTPQCVACYQKGGWLRSAYAKPITKKTHWHSRKKEFEKTLFAQQLWVHTVCTFWLPRVLLDCETGQVDCSNVVMTTGRALVQSSSQCFLCGQNGGLKVKCAHEGCAYMVNGEKTDTVFHVTCARQAGFEVNVEESGYHMRFYAKCYRHGGNEFNLRAKLEDFIEIEKRRAGKTLAREDSPMTFAHASRLLHSAIGALRVLGWAWRWAEQWVDYNSSWEPLLEPGEREEDMTNEELKIVESTRESRCADARKCRLTAFGAALRNRDFDQDDDFDRVSFDRAIRAILQTESLVGPLEQLEIDFLARWLALAYWSKSRLLGFGDDKVEVNQNSSFCLHIEDRSPKNVLGHRPLPGNVPAEISLETDVTEVDDFMRTEIMTDELLAALRTPKKRSRSPRKETSRISPRKAQSSEDIESGETHDETSKTALKPTAAIKKKKKRRGRPPKKVVEEDGAASGSAASAKNKKARGRRPKRVAEDSQEPPASSPAKKRRRKPPRKKTKDRPSEPEPASGVEESAQRDTSPPVKKRRGRPPRKKAEDLPIEPSASGDGAVSQLPSQYASLEDGQAVLNLHGELFAEAAALEESAQLDTSPPVKKRRGRPPRKKAEGLPIEPSASGDGAVSQLPSQYASLEDGQAVLNLHGELFAEAAALEVSAQLDTSPPVRKRRGRPPRKKDEDRPFEPSAGGDDDVSQLPIHNASLEDGQAVLNLHGELFAEAAAIEDAALLDPPVKKRRGRPPRKKTEDRPISDHVVSSAQGELTAEATLEASPRLDSSPPLIKRTARPSKKKNREDHPSDPETACVDAVGGHPRRGAKRDVASLDVDHTELYLQGELTAQAAATEESAQQDSAPIVKKRIGRPPKKKKKKIDRSDGVFSLEVDQTALNSQGERKADAVAAESAQLSSSQPVKKRRGRPPKIKSPEAADQAGPNLQGELATEAAAAVLAGSSPPRQRRQRQQEVTPVGHGDLATSRYDMVKRRQRQPPSRLALGSFSGKSYSVDNESLNDEPDAEDSGNISLACSETAEPKVEAAFSNDANADADDNQVNNDIATVPVADATAKAKEDIRPEDVPEVGNPAVRPVKDDEQGSDDAAGSRQRQPATQLADASTEDEHLVDVTDVTDVPDVPHDENPDSVHLDASLAVEQAEGPNEIITSLKDEGILLDNEVNADTNTAVDLSAKSKEASPVNTGTAPAAGLDSQANTSTIVVHLQDAVNNAKEDSLQDSFPEGENTVDRPANQSVSPVAETDAKAKDEISLAEDGASKDDLGNDPGDGSSPDDSETTGRIQFPKRPRHSNRDPP